jgi:hypothetical protein
MTNIIWTAVSAAVLGVITTVSAVTSNPDIALGTGLSAIAFAILAMREG